MPNDEPTVLLPLPPDFERTRSALHRVAEQVVSPARVAATGNEIALEASPGGFGTPPFPDGGRVRVELDELVVEKPGDAGLRAALKTTAAARGLAGLDEEGGDGQPLEVDPESAGALAAFYAFGDEVLRLLHAETAEADEPSPIRLWPEHFDIAFDAGAESEGRRATYGASPGDEHHPEPYIYVGPWSEPPRGPGWTAKGFRGAELGYAALRQAADPRALALEFFRGRRAALVEPPGR
jgi:hypothetical protein